MDSGIGTLWAIGAATANHGHVARLVADAAGMAARPIRDGGIGPLDVGYVQMCAAAQQLSLLTPDAVRAVASDEAGDALSDILHAVASAREAYGASAGPDRSDEDAEAFREVLARSSAEAGAAFARYATAVEGLPRPTVEEWLASRTRPEPSPSRRHLVPSVPAPRASEATSARTRSVLGEAYGVLGAAYVMRDRNADGDIGNLARFEVMALSGRINVQADALARRCGAADRPYADEVRTCADAVDNLVDRIEGKASGGASPSDALRNCAMFLAGRIRRVDAARVTMGHAVDAASVPRP